MKMLPNALTTVAGIVAVLKTNLSGWYLLLALLLFSVLFAGCSKDELSYIENDQGGIGCTTEVNAAEVA